MRIVGIDPGARGALALLDERGSLLAVEDVPAFTVTRNGKPRQEVDVLGLAEVLREWAPDVVWLEKVGGMEGDSPHSAFQFGRAAGCAETAAKMLGGRFHDVAPHVWKKAMKLVGKDKDDSRLMATNRWPAFAASFRRKMDNDRAEAALIAEYGRREMAKEGVFR